MDASKFSNLLKCYRAGLCTPEQKQLIEAWYNERISQHSNLLDEDEELKAGQRMYDVILRRIQIDDIKSP